MTRSCQSTWRRIWRTNLHECCIISTDNRNIIESKLHKTRSEWVSSRCHAPALAAQGFKNEWPSKRTIKSLKSRTGVSRHLAHWKRERKWPISRRKMPCTRLGIDDTCCRRYDGYVSRTSWFVSSTMARVGASSYEENKERAKEGERERVREKERGRVAEEHRLHGAMRSNECITSEVSRTTWRRSLPSSAAFPW